MAEQKTDETRVMLNRPVSEMPETRQKLPRPAAVQCEAKTPKMVPEEQRTQKPPPSPPPEVEEQSKKRLDVISRDENGSDESQKKAPPFDGDVQWAKKQSWTAR
jgi:hypothetical protein